MAQTLTFGRIGGAPLTWRVLQEKDGVKLLMAETPVAKHCFYEEKAATTWETCPLRAWLNGEFLTESFTEAERDSILLSRNPNLDNPEFGAPGCGDTEEKVFLLSIEEAEDPELFPTSDDRMAEIDGEYVYWWLRSVGFDRTAAAIVLNEGSVIRGGNYVSDPDGAVRPCIRIR